MSELAYIVNIILEWNKLYSCLFVWYGSLHTFLVCLSGHLILSLCDICWKSHCLLEQHRGPVILSFAYHQAFDYNRLCDILVSRV